MANSMKFTVEEIVQDISKHFEADRKKLRIIRDVERSEWQKITEELSKKLKLWPTT